MAECTACICVTDARMHFLLCYLSNCHSSARPHRCSNGLSHVAGVISTRIFPGSVY